jgi:preprotein translocase subunit SecE
VADRNRGGRSVDDNDDSRDDESFDDVDVDLDDEFDDTDEGGDGAPAKRHRTAAAARARTMSRAKTKSDDVGGPGFLGRILRFIREVVAELQKVIWPTRKELLTYTTVVIVFVSIVMSFVAGLDIAFAKLMFLVFGTTTSTDAGTN